MARENITALEAWKKLHQYRREWGINRSDAPQLSPRMEYALRRIGGIANLREAMLADFIEAWNEAPVVDLNENNQTLQIDGTVEKNERLK